MASKKKDAQDAEKAAKNAAFLDSLSDGGNESWEPVVTGKNLKFDVGQEIRGTIVKLPFTAGKSHAFDIEMETEQGSEVLTYWSPTILTNGFKKIKVGDYVAIRCTDMISTPNGDAYDFVIAKRRNG